MKSCFRTAFAVSSLCVLPSLSASAVSLPEISSMPIEQFLAIENGFDDNDKVEVAVAGYLSNTCQKLGKSAVEVDMAAKKIVVNIEVYTRRAQVCAQMKSPVTQVIDIGHLEEGRYEVIALGDTEMKSVINVAKSKTDETDDYLYAPVDNVTLKGTGKNQRLVVSGTYPNLYEGCMRVVKMLTYKTSANVLVVQPIAEIFNDARCAVPVKGFEYSKSLQFPMEGKGLVHVRTLKGSTNQFVNFSE